MLNLISLFHVRPQKCRLCNWDLISIAYDSKHQLRGTVLDGHLKHLKWIHFNLFLALVS